MFVAHKTSNVAQNVLANAATTRHDMTYFSSFPINVSRHVFDTSFDIVNDIAPSNIWANHVAKHVTTSVGWGK